MHAKHRFADPLRVPPNPFRTPIPDTLELVPNVTAPTFAVFGWVDLATSSCLLPPLPTRALHITLGASSVHKQARLFSSPRDVRTVRFSPPRDFPCSGNTDATESAAQQFIPQHGKSEKKQADFCEGTLVIFFSRAGGGRVAMCPLIFPFWLRPSGNIPYSGF